MSEIIDSGPRRELRLLLTAVQYFTRIPVPTWIGHNAMQLAHAARYFPLVGVGVGALGAGALWVGSLMFPLFVAVLVSTALTICLTGAFHEDGLADAIDGLGGAFTRERALAIMKDSRIGTFGALALLFAVLLKVAAVSSLPVHAAMLALIAGHGLSRACAVAIMQQLPYVRLDESSRAKPVVERVRPIDVTIAILCGCAPLVFIEPRPAIAVGSVIVTVLILRRWFARRIGGYTGDTLGATQQICEVVFYLAVVATWNTF